MGYSSSGQQYEINEEELLQIQQIQKEMITELDRICEKNNIKYNMVGGTMLGAIRHKGYIPWDDDADIGFLRENYEKFREACKHDLDTDRFYMQDIRDTDGYRWGYGKLRRKNTEFIRLNQEYMPYEQGIFIDLMPFDNVPDGLIKNRIHFVKCFLLRKALWSEVGSKIEKNKAKKFAYLILNRIPREKLVQKYEELIDRNANKITDTVRILTFPMPKKVFGYKRKWYTELSEYEFDELTLPGAKDYDGYLKIKYGNYMKLPPKEKRKIHPVSKLKLLEG